MRASSSVRTRSRRIIRVAAVLVAYASGAPAIAQQAPAASPNRLDVPMLYIPVAPPPIADPGQILPGSVAYAPPTDPTRYGATALGPGAPTLVTGPPRPPIVVGAGYFGVHNQYSASITFGIVRTPTATGEPATETVTLLPNELRTFPVSDAEAVKGLVRVEGGGSHESAFEAGNIYVLQAASGRYEFAELDGL